MTRTVEGTVLRGRAFEPVEGRVVIEDGEIAAIEEGATVSDAIVAPAFVNAHTHLGDSVAKEAGAGLSLDDLVGPPDGLKHRLLRETSKEETVAAMRTSLRFMQRGGTGACIEFREGGVAGVEMLSEAAAGLDIDPVVLGRESLDAMAESDGFGASSTRDGAFARERAATREAGKLFGIHAGERDSEDVTAALDLEPDFLVHMVHPDPLHLEWLDDAGVPVVACPRSNLVTGAGIPPIDDLHEATTLALGTDTVMLNSPSMFREMEFAAKLSDLPAREVLAMATVNAAAVAGRNTGLVEPGRDADLLVIDGGSDNLDGVRDPVRAVVRRAGVDDVTDVLLGGRSQG